MRTSGITLSRLGGTVFPPNSAQSLAAIRSECASPARIGLSTTPIAPYRPSPTKISRARGVTPANQLRNLFIGQAPFFSFATVLTGRECHAVFLFSGDSRTTVSSTLGMAGRLTLSRALDSLKEAINLKDSCFRSCKKASLIRRSGRTTRGCR